MVKQAENAKEKEEYELKNYNLLWNSQSKNAGESMPLGGHDIGCNVWVENNDLLLYMAQSGAFDEMGQMIKAGRVRLTLFPNPFETEFSQELRLEEGYIEIRGKNKEVSTKISLWVDVHRSVLHIAIDSEQKHTIRARYETWRDVSCHGTRVDQIEVNKNSVTFYHENQDDNVFERRIKEEELESIKDYFPNPEKDRISGGKMLTSLDFIGTRAGSYADLPFVSYDFEGEAKTEEILIYLQISHPATPDGWKQELEQAIHQNKDSHTAWSNTRKWWKELWERSYVRIAPQAESEENADWQVGRNYNLYRYMLACNAYGSYPSKFNGGLFTVDPKYFGTRQEAASPDERDWGGLVFTAQNQRLLYWPMIKNGDFDMMEPQFAFYKRIVKAGKARTRHFFGVEDSVCFPEQIDANGLSAYYGKDGLDYTLHNRYHYVTAVEFSYMMLQYAKVSGEGIEDCMEFIRAVLSFYDKMYNQKDINGKRIIFPSTSQETYHAQDNVDAWGEEGRWAANYNAQEVAVTNPADVMMALNAVLDELLTGGYGTAADRKVWSTLKEELPPIPLEMKKGHTVIAPCESPKKYVKINCEFPQLYGCYPYHEYGLGKDQLDLAKNTYFYGWDSEDQIHYQSWQYMNIFAARLGLTEEAHKYMHLKLNDSGRRFPAFWGPGHDYVPDLNWGGSGMIGVQEMLLQSFDGKIYLLPAWPKDIDVSFKLWIENRTFVTVQYQDGQLEYHVSDPDREKDIIVYI